MDALKHVRLPTLDRPFGVEMWPLFEKLWLAARDFPPQSFRFVAGTTPMSTMPETLAVLATYYVVILGGREVMKRRETGFQLSLLFKMHNLGLTLLSGGLLLLFVEQLLPTIVRRGIFYAICDADGGWTHRLVTLYYLNYITKYIELIDTVFLVLKKKPLTFLHTYHHGATALLCYTQLVGLTPISWVPITLNLWVHVVMYWYYFQAARGIKIWWKKYITIMQIVQFVVDLGFVYFATYTYFTSTYFPNMPSYGRCAGEEFAAIAGCCILSSYLLLFISFYIATYKRTGKGGRKRRNTATRATIDMARYEVPSPGPDAAGKEPANGAAKPAAANGSANGGANGSANGSANGTANGSANGTANGTAHTTATPGRPNTRSRKA